MSLLNTPLSDQEIDHLNRFLLERIPAVEAEQVEEGVDEGVLDISELDGFLTAIISGPRPIPPSEWLPLLWGEFEPQWASAEESEAIISLVLRHMNGIVTTLSETPEEFEPIVLEVEEAEETVTSVEEWCLGYMKGVGLAADAWRAAGEEVMEMLFPIVIFTTAEGRNGLSGLDAEELATLKRSIPSAVRKLHAFWMARGGMATLQTPFTHTELRVGRNDPCICGSGKKFKKCCLH
ncbi:MAG TPA: UPF0149 family protein [Gammaproteobacteria bacterium]|jgi:uncharacterized protein